LKVDYIYIVLKVFSDQIVFDRIICIILLYMLIATIIIVMARDPCTISSFIMKQNDSVKFRMLHPNPATMLTKSQTYDHSSWVDRHL